MLGGNHPNTLTTTNNLGVALREAGDLAASESVLRETLAARRAALRGNHPDIGESLLNLAVTVERRARFDEAEALLRDAVALLDVGFPDGQSIATSRE